MKLSVSLPEDDVEYLDAAANARGYPSRSAVVHRAVRLLRATELGDDYANAWADWDKSPDSAEWSTATGDGIGGE